MDVASKRPVSRSKGPVSLREIDDKISALISTNGSPHIKHQDIGELTLYLTEHYSLTIGWARGYSVELVGGAGAVTTRQTFTDQSDWLHCIDGILKLFDFTMAYKTEHSWWKNFS